MRDAKGFKQVDSSVLTDHQNYCQSFQLKAGQIIFALVNYNGHWSFQLKSGQIKRNLDQIQIVQRDLQTCVQEFQRARKAYHEVTMVLSKTILECFPLYDVICRREGGRKEGQGGGATRGAQ